MVRHLPAGRHHLTPEEVAADQRRRMLAALGRCMAEKGYAATTVADVIRGAGVSRQTFYEQFTSKHACFMAAFEAVHADVSADIDASPAQLTPLNRFDEVVGRYLDAIARNSDMARIYLIEVYAAGPDALRRRIQLQHDFVAALSAVFDARSPDDLFACQALVAVVSAMVTSVLLEGGGPDDVRELRTPLTALAARMLR